MRNQVEIKIIMYVSQTEPSFIVLAWPDTKLIISGVESDKIKIFIQQTLIFHLSNIN